MNIKQGKELHELAEQYVTILHYINLFIENNNLDYDEVWDFCNQLYDEDLSRCDEDN